MARRKRKQPFGMIRNFKVTRHVTALGFDSSVNFDDMLVRIGARAPRIALYHELGHVFGPGGKTQGGKSDRMLMKLGAPVTQRVLMEEAAAWRWAVRAWTRRGRRLGPREWAFIRICMQSYSIRRLRFVAWTRLSALGAMLPPDCPNPTPLSKGGVIRNRPELPPTLRLFNRLGGVSTLTLTRELTKLLESTTWAGFRGNRGRGTMGKKRSPGINKASGIKRMQGKIRAEKRP